MHQLESGFYGKLPAAGDFQKSLSAHGPGLEFFNWFNDGWVRTVLVGKRPVPTYPLRFAWLGAGCVTIGVIHPSHDQSGRRFPLFVFTVVAEVRDFGVLLAAAESWWLRADDAAASATRGLSAANLRLHVESLRCDLAGEVPEVEGRRSESPASSLVPGRSGSVAEWLRSLEFAFSAARRPTYPLRGLAAPTLDGIAGTVSVLCRLVGAMPSLMVWNGEKEGIAWRAMWGYPSLRHFEALLWHAVDGEQVYDVEPGRVPIPGSFAAAVGYTLDGAATVGDLIDKISHAYPPT